MNAPAGPASEPPAQPKPPAPVERLVHIEQHDRILLVTLNRPAKRNTLTPEINKLLRAAFERFRDDSDLWVAVLAGNGPDFCAGVDLSTVTVPTAATTTTSTTAPATTAPATTARAASRQAWPGGITRDFECWKPIVAALHGNVLGGGLELALCADLRIADETLRIGAPEVKWGLMQGAGATQRLPRFVPFAVALEMLFTGDPIGADRAERLGLVNQVVPVGQALAGAMDMATRISQRAPLGVRRAKEAAYAGWDQPLNEGLRTEMLLSRLLAGTEDLAEGQMAFAERRDPVWRAR